MIYPPSPAGLGACIMLHTGIDDACGIIDQTGTLHLYIANATVVQCAWCWDAARIGQPDDNKSCQEKKSTVCLSLVAWVMWT